MCPPVLCRAASSPPGLGGPVGFSGVRGFWSVGSGEPDLGSAYFQPLPDVIAPSQVGNVSLPN